MCQQMVFYRAFRHLHVFFLSQKRYQLKTASTHYYRPSALMKVTELVLRNLEQCNINAPTFMLELAYF